MAIVRAKRLFADVAFSIHSKTRFPINHTQKPASLLFSMEIFCHHMRLFCYVSSWLEIGKEAQSASGGKQHICET